MDEYAIAVSGALNQYSMGRTKLLEISSGGYGLTSIPLPQMYPNINWKLFNGNWRKLIPNSFNFVVLNASEYGMSPQFFEMCRRILKVEGYLFIYGSANVINLQPAEALKHGILLSMSQGDMLPHYNLIIGTKIR